VTLQGRQQLAGRRLDTLQLVSDVLLLDLYSLGVLFCLTFPTFRFTSLPKTEYCSSNDQESNCCQNPSKPAAILLPLLPSALIPELLLPRAIAVLLPSGVSFLLRWHALFQSDQGAEQPQGRAPVVSFPLAPVALVAPGSQ
jgi:hypothetical protein